MNRKIVITWIFLILLGYIATDFAEQNFVILAFLWAGIIFLGSTVMLKYGWKQNKFLCGYWLIVLITIFVLSAVQYYSIDQGYPLFNINHINTISMVLIGMSFLVTAFASRIVFFGPLGVVMVIGAIPLDGVQFSHPSTIYGVLMSIVLIGYFLLSLLTPQDPINLGHKYVENNGFDDEKFTVVHKFRCTNCGYTYESNEKLNYCPRCMAGADMLEDAD